MNIYLPLMFTSLYLLGMQATVTSANLEDIRSLNPGSIQLNNLRIYEDWEAYKQQAALVADMRSMVVLYFQPESTGLTEFCRWAAINIQADTFQIAQEPDMPTGMPGYYGGWGIEKIDRYAEQFIECSNAIREHSNAKVIVGLSTTQGWQEWLSALMTYPVRIDAIGIHHYNSYHWYEYNPEPLRNNIEYVKQFGFGVPVWVSELGYGCRADPDPGFYQAQADFIRRAVRDAFQFGAQRVYYYGYNPGWNCVDLKDNPLALEAFREYTR